MSVDVIFRITTVKMPDASSDVIRPRSVPSSVVDIRTEEVIKVIFLKVPDCFREEAGADEEDEVGHDDEERRDCYKGVNFFREGEGMTYWNERRKRR